VRGKARPAQGLTTPRAEPSVSRGYHLGTVSPPDDDLTAVAGALDLARQPADGLLRTCPRRLPAHELDVAADDLRLGTIEPAFHLDDHFAPPLPG